MAVMSAQDKARAVAQFMRDNVEPMAINKTDLKAALDATDSWIDTNSAAFNTALPVAARNGLTATQKTLLFCYVAMRRRGLLKAEED